jgi:hypothetical protein
LYPSDTAIDLTEFNHLLKNSSKSVRNEGADEKTINSSNNQKFFHIIIIDGTWAQASGIYYTNLELQNLKQVWLFD